MAYYSLFVSSRLESRAAIFAGSSEYPYLARWSTSESLHRLKSLTQASMVAELISNVKGEQGW
ncbi:hypothetical protein ACVFI8_05295 [Agarivorans sp. MS3-6]